MRTTSAPTVVLKLLFLLLILATATSCVDLRRSQVSYLGPQIEGVRHIQLAESDGSGRIQLFADIVGLGAGMVWAPDGDRVIVFAGPEGEARIANVETELLGPCISCLIPDASEFEFSADGTRIAVSSGDGLYVIDADGTDPAMVSDVPVPAWIQWVDGESRIGLWEDPTSILVLDLDSGAHTSLTSQYEDSGLSFFAPQWSPDGQKLAVRTSGVGGFAIQVMSADGSNLTRIADYLYRGEFLDFGALPPPQWSPDGSKLLFSGFTPAGDTDIFVVNVDGSGLQNLTNSPGKDDVPSWSPDGRQIVFVSSRDGNDEIYVMNADGSDPTNISNSPLIDEFSPAWRP